MVTKKKDIKGGLLSSLAEEEKKVDDKFKVAETHFEEKSTLNNSAINNLDSVKNVKEKAVRDAFTFPPSDHALFDEIQKKGMKVGVMVNKSEIVRAGLYLLNSLNDMDLEKALTSVDRLKTGRRI